MSISSPNSSDRHIFSLGGELDLRDPQTGSGWTFNAGGQLIWYEERTIPDSVSMNLGGLSFPFIAPVPGTFLGFTPNAAIATGALGAVPTGSGAFQYGGYLWSLGVSAKLAL